MLVRLLMLFVAAAALLAQAPETLACPTHEGRAAAATIAQPAFSDAADSPLCHTSVTPATPLCAAEGAATLCGHFHLCCVTPLGLPASEVLSLVSPAPRTAVTSRSPADTGVASLIDTPPPRS